ncbi:MAG: D-alanyl-D-alanine carboxypeptidase family protein [Bacillota bacterium]|nr:D-alanyl-D-alanine carboxypeptidase family protein [Bacillota bacterium]
MKSNLFHWKRYLWILSAAGILTVSASPAAVFAAPETGAASAAAQNGSEARSSSETAEAATKALYGTSPQQAQSARVASIAAQAAATAGTGEEASAAVASIAAQAAETAALEVTEDSQAWPSDTGIFSEAGVVVDVDSGCVLFGQNMHQQKAPASITKILTALVVLEHVDNLDQMIPYSHDAIYNTEAGSGNKYGLDEGDSLSVRDALYLLLLASSNQSANALAEYVGGTREEFVRMMNDKVAELGCSDSHFANPSGLNDDTQLTSCYDMALIGMAAYRNERLLEIGSTRSHKITTPTKNNPNGINVKMEHKLLITEDPNSENYYPFAVAGKTGYTSIAGQTLVTYAEKEGRRLIAVTMKSRQKTHYTDTINLLEFGFNRFDNVPVAEQETAISQASGNVTLGDSTYDAADLSVEEAVMTVPKNLSVTDLERTVLTGEDMPASAPDGAAAYIRYSYRDRVTGGAYVTAESLRTKETVSAGTKGTHGTKTESGENIFLRAAKGIGSFFAGIGDAVRNLSVPGIIAIAAVAGLAILTVIAFFTYSAQKRRENERLERRRARLREMGVSEEEFAEMVGRRRRSRGEKNAVGTHVADHRDGVESGNHAADYRDGVESGNHAADHRDRAESGNHAADRQTDTLKREAPGNPEDGFLDEDFGMDGELISGSDPEKK